MPDGPTVGGYPKLAVVIGPDLGRLAQSNPGEEVRFRRVSVEEAEAAYRREVEELRALERLSAAVENHE
jgi:allophanate hydrolase subunit 2